MELDFSPYALQIIRRAAEIEGRSVSEFIAAAAEEVAQHTIERTRIISNSMAAHERLMKALSKQRKTVPGL